MGLDGEPRGLDGEPIGRKDPGLLCVAGQGLSGLKVLQVYRLVFPFVRCLEA